MKIHRVGTSFLDDHTYSDKSKSRTYNHDSHSVIKNAQDRKPLITPCIKSSGSGASSGSARSRKGGSGGGGGDEGQQYLLIPNKDHILVLSMSHGQTVCKLEPYSDTDSCNNNNGNRSILTAAIVNYKKRHVVDVDINMDKDEDHFDSVEYSVVAGFSDGTMQEWFLSSIPLDRSKNKIILPKRKFRIPHYNDRASITHITSPVGGEGDGLLYALVKIKKEMKFIRITMPYYFNSDDDDDGSVNFVNLDNNVCLLTTVKQLYHTEATTVETRAEESTENEIVDGTETYIGKKELVVRKLPFSLTSLCCERKGAKVTYVVMVDERGIVVYCEDSNSSHQTDADATTMGRFVSYFQEQTKGSFCAVALAPNGEDVALGCTDGKIDVLVSVLSKSASYVEDPSPSKMHPKNSLIKRTIHWHALPVKTLCYLGLPGSRAAPNLLSGGEEAVVVTWNIERGLTRPANTLPRISKGCITHIATNPYPISISAGSTDMDIVVRCMDNTIQLIHGNNHAIRWKIQGLASSNNECVDVASEPSKVPSPMLHIDPKTRTLLMTRLSGAPGFIHWYDLTSNQVVGELEVAPYNRISRKEAHHNAYPRPTVTNFVFSASGNDLITVDTMLTENTSLGKSCEVQSFVKEGTDLSQKMSLVTNIKFWSWSSGVVNNTKGERRGKGMPFELISAMPNPHGYVNGEIDALAISNIGNKACSLSTQDGAFHIWGKGKTLTTENNSLSPLLPSWKRLCKITIPSGYSSTPKHETGKDKNSTVVFSDDGSVLAIAFGRHITLWDHSNATLLKTFCTHESLCNIQFVRTPLDMILAVGKSSVSILPPFCSGYLGNDSWSYNLPENFTRGGKKIELGLVTPLASRKELAVAMKETQEKAGECLISTKVVVVDITSGKAKKRDDGTTCHWEVEGNVVCLCDISQRKEENWASEQAALLVLTDSNEIFILDADNDHGSTVEKNTGQKYSSLMVANNNNFSALTSTDAPRLDTNRKRKSEEESVHGVVVPSAESKNVDAVGRGSLVFDSVESTSLSTSQLPALSGNFARSFISRNFKKFKNNE